MDLVNNSYIAFCFEIKLCDNTIKLLTSRGQNVKIGDKVFISNSGLHIIRADFNDCAKDFMQIGGIYEEKGIIKDDFLENSTVNISVYDFSAKTLTPWVTLYCSKVISVDFSFILVLESISKLLDKEIVSYYSPKCRAKFCDVKCKLNKFDFEKEYEIEKIIKNNIHLLKNYNLSSGYYSRGEVNFLEYNFNTSIRDSIDNILILDTIIPDRVKTAKRVLVVSGCDKHISTCCKIFNNAINFRGEPFMIDRVEL